MSGPDPVGHEDLGELAVTDALLDDLASGRRGAGGKRADAALTDLLASWRAELDDRAATVMTVEPVLVPVTPAAQPVRWARAHRRTAAAAAVIVALAGSTGIAAAESSPTGPLGGLHTLFFGDSPSAHHVDVLAIDAQKLLITAGQQINAAAQTGSIGADMRDQIAGALDQAERLLQRDALAPQSLLDKLRNLRTALAGIPDTAPAPTPSPVGSDDHGHDGPRSDDGRPGDHQGRSGDDRKGDDNSSDNTSSNGSGSDGGSAQGSEDGSGSDTGQSGEDGGGSRSGSNDPGSGSDDGSGSGGD